MPGLSVSPAIGEPGPSNRRSKRLHAEATSGEQLKDAPNQNPDASESSKRVKIERISAIKAEPKDATIIKKAAVETQKIEQRPVKREAGMPVTKLEKMLKRTLILMPLS